MKKDEITAELFRLKDDSYAELQSKLVPTVDATAAIALITHLIFLIEKIKKEKKNPLEKQ